MSNSWKWIQEIGNPTSAEVEIHLTRVGASYRRIGISVSDRTSITAWLDVTPEEAIHIADGLRRAASAVLSSLREEEDKIVRLRRVARGVNVPRKDINWAEVHDALNDCMRHGDMEDEA